MGEQEADGERAADDSKTIEAYITATHKPGWVKPYAALDRMAAELPRLRAENGRLRAVANAAQSLRGGSCCQRGATQWLVSGIGDKLDALDESEPDAEPDDHPEARAHEWGKEEVER